MDTSSLTENEQRTLETYEESARTWADNRAGGESFWKPELETFRQMQTAGDVLDVGSGNGRDAVLLTRNGYQVTCLDISVKLLEIARNRCPQATFVHGSVYELPFEDQSFDGVWAVASLLHLPKNRMQEALCEIRRALREGGALFVTLKTGEGEGVVADSIGERFFSFWQPEEFATQLVQAGFEVTSWHQREAAGNNWLCLFARR